MPPRPTQRTQYNKNTPSRSSQNTYQYNNNQKNTIRVRNISTTLEDKLSQAGSTHSTENESVDPESTCYIREIMEDWSIVNFIKKRSEIKVNKINKSELGEYWIATRTGDTKLQWLVDTGSPRSFVSESTANKLISKLGKSIKKSTTQVGEFRCFNKNKIKIQEVIQINITSGNSSAGNCDNLVVPQNTVNLLGRDVLQKLGTQLAKKQKGEKILRIQLDKSLQISHKVFKKYPHLCTRLGRSKNHMAKSTFKQYFKPTQLKGIIVPLDQSTKSKRS